VGKLLSLVCLAAVVGACSPGLAGEATTSLEACPHGAVSGTCSCDGTSVSSGYCCAGIAQASACATTPACGEGAVSSTCLCGAATVSSGYCCGGVAQASACATTPACGQGAVSSTCVCGAATVSSGYCCAGVAQASACATTPACGQGAVSSACVCGGATVSSGYCCGGLAQASACGSALIVDHRAAAAFDSIPAEWLAAAKALTMQFAHTSHGSQIITGLEQLRRRDAKYAFAVRAAGTEGLPAAGSTPALRIYDGNPPDTYITPEMYWATDSGLAATRSVAATGHYGFSMWSWCGQQSSNSTSTVQQYLTRMAGLESDYSPMRFILMTGHTDGSNTPGTAGTLKFNNQLVRSYASSSGMVLYDFEDIESYDPAGTYYPTTTDACSWCSTWCSAHPADCADLGQMGDCAHSHPFNCIQKAKAFWWMMARLAGWSGN
jgi:hypothetical protein